MLLEYFRPEYFKSLAKFENSKGWRGQILEKLEAFEQSSESDKAKQSPEKPGSELPKEFELWLKDEWIIEWLKLEPKFKGFDLKQYFYFSRDILTGMSDVSSRMSLAAKDILLRLLSESDAVKILAIKDSKQLNLPDVQIIIDELVSKFRQEEDINKKERIINVLLEIINCHTSLATYGISIIEKLPEETLSLSVVPNFWKTYKDTAYSEIAKNIMVRWSKSSVNNLLARAAERVLKKGE